MARLCVSLGHVGASSWWCHLVTVCQFAIDSENIHAAVSWCAVKMSADRPDQDRSRRPDSTMTDGDIW